MNREQHLFQIAPSLNKFSNIFHYELSKKKIYIYIYILSLAHRQNFFLSSVEHKRR